MMAHRIVPTTHPWLCRMVLLALLIILGQGLLGQLPAAHGQVVIPPLPGTDTMRILETPYYIIRSDVPDENLREVVVRMNRMAEEYVRRTRSFSGTINNKLPFYLFATQQQYVAGGGAMGSAGQFTGQELMAIAGDKLTADTWHTIQHEGFHQFAVAVIGGDLPIWANEGLAEYFGEALYTGDGFVTGVVPSWRMKRIQLAMLAGQFMPIDQMMFLSHRQWNEQLALENYDQAWSMVHFLANGENGKYQKPFANFMRAVSAGTPWREAWVRQFGNSNNFENQWKKYWLSMPENESDLLYLQAATQSAASFMGRGLIQGQTFADWSAFVEAAEAGKLNINDANWLPPTVLADAVDFSKKHGTWTIEIRPKQPPMIVATTEDGTRAIAWCTLKNKKVAQVNSVVETLTRDLAQAMDLQSKGEIAKAKQLLQAAIKANPQAPGLADARAALAKMK